jgi:hypothetical protein
MAAIVGVEIFNASASARSSERRLDP